MFHLLRKNLEIENNYYDDEYNNDDYIDNINDGNYNDSSNDGSYNNYRNDDDDNNNDDNEEGCKLRGAKLTTLQNFFSGTLLQKRL